MGRDLSAELSFCTVYSRGPQYNVFTWLFVQCIHVVPSAMCSRGCLITLKEEREWLAKGEKKLKEERKGSWKGGSSERGCGKEGPWNWGRGHSAITCQALRPSALTFSCSAGSRVLV